MVIMSKIRNEARNYFKTGKKPVFYILLIGIVSKTKFYINPQVIVFNSLIHQRQINERKKSEEFTFFLLFI